MVELEELLEPCHVGAYNVSQAFAGLEKVGTCTRMNSLMTHRFEMEEVMDCAEGKDVVQDIVRKIR